MVSTNQTENTPISMQIYTQQKANKWNTQNKQLMKVFIEANNYKTKDMHNIERNHYAASGSIYLTVCLCSYHLKVVVSGDIDNTITSINGVIISRI